MIFSAGADQLAVVAYVPDANKDELDCKEWLAHVMRMIGGEILTADGVSGKGVVKTNSDKGIFPLKVKEPGIMEAITFLKKKGLFPDKEDSDDDYVFGDDDFPS